MKQDFFFIFRTIFKKKKKNSHGFFGGVCLRQDTHFQQALANIWQGDPLLTLSHLWTLITTARGVEENEDGFSHGRIYLFASKHPLLI